MLCFPAIGNRANHWRIHHFGKTIHFHFVPIVLSSKQCFYFSFSGHFFSFCKMKAKWNEVLLWFLKQSLLHTQGERYFMWGPRVHHRWAGRIFPLFSFNRYCFGIAYRAQQPAKERTRKYLYIKLTVECMLDMWKPDCWWLKCILNVMSVCPVTSDVKASVFLIYSENSSSLVWVGWYSNEACLLSVYLVTLWMGVLLIVLRQRLAIFP